MSFSGNGTDKDGRRRTTNAYRTALGDEYARLAALRATEQQQQNEAGSYLNGKIKGEKSVGGWKHAHTNDPQEDPAAGMTAEEKFHFDLAGFFVRRSVLSEAEVAAVRSQIYLIKHDPAALPEHERHVPAGAASLLIDHPKVVPVLEELLGGKDLVRLEHAQAFWRTRGGREDNAGSGFYYKSRILYLNG